MSITSIELLARNPGDPTSLISIPMRDDFETPVFVVGVSGLSIDKLGSAAKQWSMGYRQTPEPREITLLLGLRPNYEQYQTMQSLRDHIYRSIAQTPYGIIIFRMNMEDGSARETEALVTKVDTNPATATPQLQLTLKALSPVFTGLTTNQSASMSGGSKLTVLDEVSTAPHGMTFEFELGSGVSPTQPIVFTRTSSSDTFTLNIVTGVVSAWAAGQRITVDSRSGSRSVYMSAGGLMFYINACVGARSVWPEVRPGVPEEFTSSAPGTFIDGQMSYRHTFWGV